jgi:hypothetical protein
LLDTGRSARCGPNSGGGERRVEALPPCARPNATVLDLSRARGERFARLHGAPGKASPDPYAWTLWTRRVQTTRAADATSSIPTRCAWARCGRAARARSTRPERRCRVCGHSEGSRRAWEGGFLAARLCVREARSRSGVVPGEAGSLELGRPRILGVARQKDRAWTRLDSWSRGRALYRRFCRRLCLNRSEQKPAQKRICR